MTNIQIQLSLIESKIKADPNNDNLKALYNLTACSELVDEQIDMLNECDPKQEAIRDIERSNGLSAISYFNI